MKTNRSIAIRTYIWRSGVDVAAVFQVAFLGVQLRVGCREWLTVIDQGNVNALLLPEKSPDWVGA